MLIEVIKSWQVLVMTGALVLYMFLVNYVARTYHQPRYVSKSKPRTSKAKAAKAQPKEVEITEDDDPNAALGLEEK